MSSTSKTGSPAMKQLQSLPGLKLKTFSKMRADSRNQVLEKTGSTVTGSDSDIIMVEGKPETAPAPSMPPLAMSITKVKKPAMPFGEEHQPVLGEDDHQPVLVQEEHQLVAEEQHEPDEDQPKKVS